jgi:hypothetical protein
MSLFSNPIRTDLTVEEGTVIQVDGNRSICKVKTLRGQVLHEVLWLLPSGGSTRGSDRISPAMGDRVMLNYGLGYPVIVGFLPRIQTEENTDPISLSSDSVVVDTGVYGPAFATSGDQNKSKDSLPGDRVISTVGGSLLALLRGGALILRASKGAEIFMSNFTGFVRILSRNWAHFSDVGSDVIRNFKGKVYRYTGYSKSFTNNKNEDYKLHFYYGDVKAAETVKTNYDTYSGTPTTDSILYKEQVSGTSPAEYMRRTINDTGEQEIVINNGTHITRITSTAESVVITWNDQNVVTLNETNFHVVHKDGADLVMNSTGITGTMGGGQVIVTNSQSKLSNNGHQILITSSGVAIT